MQAKALALVGLCALTVALPLPAGGVAATQPVSDYFGTLGSLGITIKNSVSLFDFETAWAAILTASILGVALYVVVSLGERFALQWDPTRQERGIA